jgi:hypothetical protein
MPFIQAHDVVYRAGNIKAMVRIFVGKMVAILFLSLSLSITEVSGA